MPPAAGALVAITATLPVPTEVKLKDPKNFKLIGMPVKRLDAPGKINGSATLGLDVLLPGSPVSAASRCASMTAQQ